MFFPAYLAVEIPSNLAIQRWRPSLWLPTLVVATGSITLFLGFVGSYAGVLVMRCVLGLVQGGIFPGLVL